MLPNIGFGEWAIILVLVLLFFGPKRLPELARSIAQAMTAFKKGMGEGAKEEGSREAAARPRRKSGKRGKR